MSLISLASEPACWYALRVRSRHEKSVSRFLDGIGCEWFLPLYRKQHIYQAREKVFEVPVFSGYIFSRFAFSSRLQILKTPGVVEIVSSCGRPLPIEDSEIVSIQKAVNARLEFQPCPFLQAGAKVVITSGPLSGVEGSVVRHKESLRIVLSITILQRSVLVEVAAQDLSPADLLVAA